MNADTLPPPTREPLASSPEEPRRAGARTGLSILSFGSTRGMWEGESAEDYQRMMGYAAQLDDYVIIANSYKRHGLRPRRFAPNVEAIPTNAFNCFDTLARMFWIGCKLLRSRKFTLIQAQEPLDFGLVAVLLGKMFGVPVNVCLYGPNVFDEHYLQNHWIHRFLSPIGRWVLHRCAGIQVDGKMTQRRLVAAGFPAESIVVKPVVPANLELFLILPPAAPSATPRLLYVGRLSAQKNLLVLVEAARRLKDGGHRFELEIVGEGPMETEIRAAVEAAGLGEEVRFRGVVAREQIAAVFGTADIFVLTSDFEGYPRVLMEAAAAARPVVTTAVSGSDEAVVDRETGFIVPVGDAEAVAAKLAVLLEQPELRARMGAAGRQHIRVNLDPRTNTPAQIAIWQRIADLAPSVESARPRRLLLFNLVTDVKHPILGFTTQWIRELAARVEVIHVITMQSGEIVVPDNVHVHSVGRERGYSEPRRVLEFYRHLFRILSTERIDGCFSHMMQIFSVLAGPVLRLYGIPLVTWYAHPSLPLSVKLAHFLSDRMVTSLPNAYPYRKDKLAVIGQGIDTSLFSAAEAGTASADTILCVGRLSRVKNHPTLLRAVAALPRRYRVVILGATSGPDDEAYAGELRQLVEELGLGAMVSFEKGVPSAELPAHYRRCAVHVNLTPAGFGDKVAWEAMSCGRPCLVANEDFRETLGRYASELIFRDRDVDDLTAKLGALLEKTPAERDEIGAYLRTQVARLHALPRLADRILDELARCRVAST
jgi:glycosyltransferase involved in cell wall biosynthesis